MRTYTDNINSYSGFGILPKDTCVYRLQELGIEPLIPLTQLKIDILWNCIEVLDYPTR